MINKNRGGARTAITLFIALGLIAIVWYFHLAPGSRSGIKTYIAPLSGISFSYPSDWKIVYEAGNAVRIENPMYPSEPDSDVPSSAVVIQSAASPLPNQDWSIGFGNIFFKREYVGDKGILVSLSAFDEADKSVEEKILASVGVSPVYRNDEYGFSLVHPLDTRIDVVPGNQIESGTPQPGKIAVFEPASTKGSLVIEAEPSQDCLDTASGADPAHKTINGIDFTVYNLDRIMSRSVNKSAREYCVVHKGVEFKLIAQLPYAGTPLKVDNDAALNAMLTSFKFID